MKEINEIKFALFYLNRKNNYKILVKYIIEILTMKNKRKNKELKNIMNNKSYKNIII